MILLDRPKLIRQVFEGVIKDLPAKFEEQRYFLLNHPNYPFWVTAMEKQIRIAELNPRLKMTQKLINDLIKAGAQIACQCWIDAKVKQLMTPAELRRHQDKADEMKNTQEMLDDMAKEARSTAFSKGTYTGGSTSDTIQASESGLAPNPGVGGSILPN